MKARWLAAVATATALSFLIAGCTNSYIAALTPGANRISTDAITGLNCAVGATTSGCDTTASATISDTQALQQTMSATTAPSELASDAQLLANDVTAMLALNLAKPLSWNDAENLAEAMQHCIADMNATEG